MSTRVSDFSQTFQDTVSLRAAYLNNFQDSRGGEHLSNMKINRQLTTEVMGENTFSHRNHV